MCALGQHLRRCCALSLAAVIALAGVADPPRATAANGGRCAVGAKRVLAKTAEAIVAGEPADEPGYYSRVFGCAHKRGRKVRFDRSDSECEQAVRGRPTLNGRHALTQIYQDCGSESGTQLAVAAFRSLYSESDHDLPARAPAGADPQLDAQARWQFRLDPTNERNRRLRRLRLRRAMCSTAHGGPTTARYRSRHRSQIAASQRRDHLLAPRTRDQAKRTAIATTARRG